jgi:cytoskeleton protein RodZ
VIEQPPQVPVLPVIDTPEGLAAVRAARGLSQSDLAQRLKLSVRQLDALERGDWDALPGRAFVRGVVRAYGRMFNADVAPLLDQVGAATDPQALRPSASLAAPMPRRGALGFAGSGRGHLAVWLLLGVAVVVALAFFFGRGDIDGLRPQPVSPPAADPAATGDARPEGTAPREGAPASGQDSLLLVPAPPSSPAPGSPDMRTPSAPSSLQSIPPAPPATSPAPQSAQPAAPGTAPTTGATPGAAGGVTAGGSATAGSPAATPAAPGATSAPLRIAASQDAWVEVRQADGKVVFSAVVRAGSSAEVQGAEPLSLVVGNANQVRIEYRGRAVELRPAANNIARLQLP